ncbi:PH domain-containing protein [Winogradskyella pulchriflava]|uniref:PH domain-containing protein n=1 Tax=Winogradskyella pulchriflava TaxID=1110688 RepID=A0ABV6Q7Z6_9FLAO
MNFTNLQIETESLPKIDEVNLKPIAKSYLKIIALNKLVYYIALVGLTFIVKLIIEKKSEVQIDLWYIIFVVIGFCMVNFIVALLAFRKRKYAVREHDIIYSKGLLMHSITTIPISRIQHVEESRSWLARYFGLSTLKIFTAGESGSDLSIKGLEHLEAKGINDFISARVNGNN